MSMSTYGGQVTGLIIKEEIIPVFIRRYIESHPEEFDYEDNIGDIEYAVFC